MTMENHHFLGDSTSSNAGFCIVVLVFGGVRIPTFLFIKNKTPKTKPVYMGMQNHGK